MRHTRVTGVQTCALPIYASKNWEDANIQITPASAFNEIGTAHLLTGHVNVNDGTGYVNAAAGTTINFSIVSGRSEEHTSELQSHLNLVCRLLLVTTKKPRVTLVNAETSALL